MAWSGCGAPSASARWQRRARADWLAWSDSGSRRLGETHTADTVASATTRAASRSRGRRLTGGYASGSGDFDALTDVPHRRRGAAGSRRSPPTGRSCRGESPLAETGERLINSLGEPRLTALEQRQAWPRRHGLLDQRSDGFADQLGLAAAAGSRDPPQRALEIVWKVHGRLEHAIHSIIMDEQGAS